MNQNKYPSTERARVKLFFQPKKAIDTYQSIRENFTKLKGDDLKKSKCNYCGGLIGEGCSRWTARYGKAEYHSGLCILSFMEPNPSRDIEIFDSIGT